MISLLRRYPRVLAFGALLTLWSGPGQTYLISFFIPHMRSALGLGREVVSDAYLVATAASAFVIPFLGKCLDRIKLVRFAVAAGVFLGAGLLILSRSSNILSVLLGFFLIRNLGQGAFVLTSSTTMARVFGRERGKALAITQLGYPVGEALFPIIVTFWILSFDWRSAWALLGGLVLGLVVPLIYYLIRHAPEEKVRKELNLETSGLSLSDVLKDWRYYTVLPSILAPPCFVTALFFHQGDLMAWKGWGVKVIASSFIAFAAGRVLSALIVGPLIDRYSARRILPFALLPMISGLLALIYIGSEYGAVFYLLGLGATMGLGMTLSPALWAEFYGTQNLGSIRGFHSSLIVLSTAVSPSILIRILRNINMDFCVILSGMVVLSCLSSIMTVAACVSRKARHGGSQ